MTKKPSGKFTSAIWWGGKGRNIGTFDTPEQASAAMMSVKNDLDQAKLSAIGTDEADAIFDAVKTKAVGAVGASVPERRELPTGVGKLPSGRFQARIKFGGKNRYIGTFDTPEQASAAYISARKDLDDAKLKSCIDTLAADAQKREE